MKQLVVNKNFGPRYGGERIRERGNHDHREAVRAAVHANRGHRGRVSTRLQAIRIKISIKTNVISIHT